MKNHECHTKIASLLRTKGQQVIIAIHSIAHATDLLGENLKDVMPADIDAAIEHAVDRYVNDGESAAQAVAIGIQLANDRILHRRALLQCAELLSITPQK